jgi:activating signal cointegrator 1
VKALTIRQPWASLIAAGVKTIETRGWRTSYRGDILIHAGRTMPPNLDIGPWYRSPRPTSRSTWSILHEDRYQDDLPGGGKIALPLGAVVAVAGLVDVVPIDRWAKGAHVGNFPHDGPLPHQRGGLWLIGHTGYGHGTPTYIEDQRPLGDFTPGRYAWLLDNVRPLPEPIPAKGKQGLWTPDAELLDALPAEVPA